MNFSSNLARALAAASVVWWAAASIVGQSPIYLDATRPVSERVEDLLGRMTLEEKVGQMNMPCVYEGGLGQSIPEKMDGCRRFVVGDPVPGLGPGGGFFTLANTILHEGPEQQVKFFNELQRLALERTRLKIPLLQTEEGTHGLMCSGATIFPEGLALGSSWNLDLVRQVYEATAREARSVGIHQLYTLVIEPYRDPRLGRSQEGYSEDPYMVARFAGVIAEAVQGSELTAPDKAVAGFCHYPGQSEPASGLERGAMEISERKLREVFLPPWEVGIREKGALGVMATYPAVDGVPTHASSWLLTDILRGELGFQGLVLSEGGGIETLVYEGLAADQKEAGQLALRAGVDVGISYESGYMLDLIASVREGIVPEELVDRAVRRILGLKFRLGLFERPFADPDLHARVVHNPRHRELALQAAREGIVLLKNRSRPFLDEEERPALPLRKDLRRIAVLGPNADNPRNQLGDYTSTAILQEIVTVLEGIRRAVSPSTEVAYLKGCDVTGTATSEDFQEVQREVASADVAVVVVGENEWQAENRQGTSGEAFDSARLELTGLQKDLVEVVSAHGIPTVVVLINGRPLALPWLEDHADAIVEAWSCGELGGIAVAEVLFGDYNPSGRLPVTVPRHAGQLPVYYNHKKSKSYWIEHGWGRPYVDLDPRPLYEFGYGLSYTTFEYSNLSITPTTIQKEGKATIRLEVKNAGERTGSEVVQLYVSDRLASVSTPVLELKGFEKLQLEPGERKVVTFELDPEHLALFDRGLRRIVEPGDFEIRVGHSSQDIRLTGLLKVE